MQPEQQGSDEMRLIRVFGSNADPIVFHYRKKEDNGGLGLQPEMTIKKVKKRIGQNSYLGFCAKPIFFKLYLATGQDMVLGEPLDVRRTLGSYIDGNDAILVVKFLDDDDIVSVKRREIGQKKIDPFFAFV